MPLPTNGNEKYQSQNITMLQVIKFVCEYYINAYRFIKFLQHFDLSIRSPKSIMNLSSMKVSQYQVLIGSTILI